MGRKKIIKFAIFLLSISFLFITRELLYQSDLYAGNVMHASAKENNRTIVKGVFIDEVDVSGMTKEQAEAAVRDYVEGLRNKGVAILMGKNIVYTTMGALGYEMEENDNIDTALSLGTSGNLIKQYKDMKDIEQGNIVYPISFIYDKTKIRDIVEVDVSSYNVAPVNATITRKNGKFIYGDHVVGRKVNVDATVNAISEALDSWKRQDIVVEAVVEDDMPLYTRDVVEQCNTVIGTFTTEYTDSAEGRAANLANGARLINNAVLYPGDVFSGYKYLTPFTKENGYYVAGAYLQGKVIDSVGGGACQVTTTLYNAVLNAELEVVERQPHSMTISYVDLSRDAAIAGTYKDFKFKNNTDAPIVIEATTKGRRITFKLWGKETRDNKNRTVEYETKILSETAPPPDVITKDPNQPEGYRKVTQSAHTGYKAELYKVVYENGIEVSRVLVNKSNYAPAPKYVTIGTKKVETPEETTDPKDTKNSADKKDTKKDNDKKDNTQPDTNEPDASGDETQDESEADNLANPQGQIQADVWDESWYD
ncbi:vancomycin resistance protein YoaR [Anaerotaenia torta]|uniref:VanW family protein n=1 Tax=Anaerotaenia torta TaxID=433293 RepID=UPI003D1C5823